MPQKIDAIQLTLLGNARPGLTTKELFKIARAAHPDAKKKDIVRAAIGALIAISDSDPERALVLQNFAILGRGGDE